MGKQQGGQCYIKLKGSKVFNLGFQLSSLGLRKLLVVDIPADWFQLSFIEKVSGWKHLRTLLQKWTRFTETETRGPISSPSPSSTFDFDFDFDGPPKTFNQCSFV